MYICMCLCHCLQNPKLYRHIQLDISLLRSITIHVVAAGYAFLLAAVSEPWHALYVYKWNLVCISNQVLQPEGSTREGLQAQPWILVPRQALGRLGLWGHE